MIAKIWRSGALDLVTFSQEIHIPCYSVKAFQTNVGAEFNKHILVRSRLISAITIYCNIRGDDMQDSIRA